MNGTSSSLLQASQPSAAAPSEYAAVENGGEQYNGANLMVGAYAAIWVVLMTWIFLLWRKQAALGERLEGLERAIDRAALETSKKPKAS